MAWFHWQERPAQALQGGGVIAPDERLPWAQTGLMGLQHVIAMFGSTVLAPLLMGFDPNLAVFMSGLGTLLFFAITGGRVPSYLGSSFAFIGVVIAATGYAGQGPNPQIDVALGGIIAPYLQHEGGEPRLLCREVDTGGALIELTVMLPNEEGGEMEVELMMPGNMVRMIVSVKHDGRFGFGRKAEVALL